MTYKHIAFFAYPVTDIIRSREFYENVLQLPPAANYNDEWVEYEVAGGTIAITPMIKELQPGAKGGFFALEVEDLDSAVAEMKAKNVPFIMDTFESPVCRMAVVADPDGNWITLHQCKKGH